MRAIIEEDIKDQRHGGRVHTRFPPEPNGYLHIGHAKAICLNYGLACEYEGSFNLRFDDTNPTKEEEKYITAIQEDVKWLGVDWGERVFFASDYFEQLYAYAVQLIQAGLAFVCELTPEQVRAQRGTLTEPGTESPYRQRPIEENMDLFARMRAGEFPDGAMTLRAKIDMSSGNLNLRDPVMYRILHAHHPRTGTAWCVYPTYDFTHGQSDSIEGITHSICTLEFADHRPLYDWYIEKLGIFPSRQFEYARLVLPYTVMSKRKLITLVNEGYVNGWDDPRLSTLRAYRRKGYTPEAIRDFCSRVGVAKSFNQVDPALLAYCIRKDLNAKAQRVMCVQDPVKLVIDNYPDEQVEWLASENNPEDPTMGKREIPFSREIYIERADFMEQAPRKYFRLSPGKEVRLKDAFYVTCTDVEKDEDGQVRVIHANYDPQSRGGWTQDGRKVKGTLHWVSVAHARRCEVRLYENLFTVPDPSAYEAEGKPFLDFINPQSLTIVEAWIEPSVSGAAVGTHYQFVRQAYCVVDPDSTPDKLVFNRTVDLKDSWKPPKG
ncbi:MAG: glutamine--tRNA ligase/YqeY domain fusion protein [Gammaproteobacteria bacterium]